LESGKKGCDGRNPGSSDPNKNGMGGPSKKTQKPMTGKNTGKGTGLKSDL